MPKGISGSGGVDTSSLDGLISQLNNILEKQNEINSTRVSPKADDKELKPIAKTLEEIRNEAKNTSRTNIELWNTKALKKQIGEAKKILDDSLKSFDISKISTENISGFEKEFLKAFATIKTYSEKYGQEITSEYQNMFDAIFNKSDVFKQDYLQALFQKNINAALSNVKKGSFDVKYEANENWANEQYKVYKQQTQIAKETANAVKQAEREKQEALMNTRDKILEETKTQLQQIKDMSADNKFLEVDDEQWARFQKSAGDMIQTLSEMGVEVRDLEDIFESLSKKIYIPKDQFTNLKQGSITENVIGDVSEIDKTQQKVNELYDEILRLQNIIDNAPTNEAYDELAKDYEEARIKIVALKDRIYELDTEIYYSIDSWSWDQKVAEVERLEKEIDELKNKLKSTGGTGGEGLSEKMSKGFNSEELTSFLNVLERIEQQLKNIATTLGTVDEKSSFSNLMESLDKLFYKLDKMREKIGTGIYNIEIKQGENFGSASDLLISSERDKLMQSYNKIVKAFGDEEKLFSTMGNVLNKSSGLGSSSDDLFSLFSKDAVASINNPMEQINRIREFLVRFKEVRSELREEVELLNKDLDYAQDKLKNTSNKDEKNDIKNNIKNIKRQVRSTSELSQMVDKLSTPSSTNAYLNKKLDSANESEKEFIQKMHEMDSVDLSEVIGQLEKICTLLTEISQKDLFGESFSHFSQQLDEIIDKFDNIIASVKIVNEEPVKTYDKDVETSVDKTREAVETLITDEKRLDQVSEEVAQQIANEFLGTGEKVRNLKEEIKELFQLMSSGNDMNINGVIGALSNSKGVREQLGGEYAEWEEIKKFITKGHIKISSDDRANIGEDEWNHVQKKLQLRNSGSDALNFLDELREHFGYVIDEANGTAEAIRLLYDFVNNPPDASSDYKNMLKAYGGEEILEEYLKKGYDSLNQATDTYSNVDNIENATAAIEEEGKVAEKSAVQKEQFVIANQKVAESGFDTAESIEKAAEAIKEEGEVVSENKIDISQFEDMIKISDDLKEQLGGVVDVYQRIRKDSDDTYKASYRLVGKNGYAWVGANGDLLDRNIKTSEEYTAQKNAEAKATKEAAQAQREYESLLAKRSTEAGNLNSAIVSGNAAAIKGSTERINALNKEIETIENKGNVDKKAAQESLRNITAVTKATEKQAKAEQNVAKQTQTNLTRQKDMYARFATWVNQNSKAERQFGEEIRSIMSELKNSSNLTSEALDNLQNKISGLKARVADADKLGKSFGDTLKQRFQSLAAYVSTFASFYDIIRYVREAADTVREYDTALTEMRKVSDESVSSLKDYASTTFEVGDSVGATALTIQNSTADWLRLGEAMEDASESAKVSNILLNVSEFENINEATEALVSASQAYKNLDKIEIVDKLNNIGNNFSISTDKLAQGLQNTAAVLQTQGNDIDEAVALLTAANSQVQDISKASMGVRTISLRIASTEEAKAQLEDLGEDVEDFVVQTNSKTQQTIKNFTAVASNMGKGVDVLDENGNLRNTYEILLDISKIYKEIQEEDKKYGTNRANALVEFIAGKNRANIAASILNAPDLLEEVYKSSQKSEGSAQVELDKYLESVDGKITQSKNHLQELANVTINSDSLKTLLDILNKILPATTSIIDNFGLINTALVGFAGFKGATGAGLIYKLRCVYPCYG